MRERHARRARSSRRSAATRSAAGASSCSTPRSRIGCPDIGVVGATTSSGSAPSGRRRARQASRDDARSTSSPARLHGLRCRAAPTARTGDVRARLEQRALELASRSICSTAPRRAGRDPRRQRTAAREACDRRRPRREPARRDALRRRARRRPPRRRAAPHRLVRQLAVGRVRRRRQPAPRLPAHQQELRALLRLRGPLMLTLLRDLRRLRRSVALPRPDRGRSLAIRHVDAGSCNGCEHELTLASSPYYDLQRFGLGIVASPRHADVLLVTGPVTTRMREPLLTAYAAMPEPRRVAALGDCALGCGMLGAADEIVGPVETCSPSTCASPAARQPRGDRDGAARARRPSTRRLGNPRSARHVASSCDHSGRTSPRDSGATRPQGGEGGTR